jgi:hypothetical protein
MTPRMTDHNLILPQGWLVVFVDDTGHEALVPGHSVYGLGGCAVMENDLEQVIRKPWRKLRQRITGSPNEPLHASDFARGARQEDIEAIATFFREQPFARIGSIVSVQSTLAPELGPVPTIARTLQKRIVDISQWTAFKELKVIFEHSDRANPLIQAAFSDFSLQEDGRPIPVECYFMPKSANEPALEVADFIMHAVGRQARQNLKQRDVFVPDFRAVFQSVDQKLVSFIEVNTATKNNPAQASI